MQKVIFSLALARSRFLENATSPRCRSGQSRPTRRPWTTRALPRTRASYLESLPQASTPTVEAKVAAPSYLESLPSLEAAVAAPAAVKPTPTPAELAAAAAPVKLASGAEADFAARRAVSVRADEEAPVLAASDFPIKPE